MPPPRATASHTTAPDPAPATAPDPTPATALRFDNLSGPEVLAAPQPWLTAYTEVYTGRGLADHTDPPISERLPHSAGRAGFRLTAAYADEELAGFVYGYTLPRDTGWWEGLFPEHEGTEPGFTTEWPGRTFAVCEGLIRTPYRRLHVAERALSMLLHGRGEERAASLVAEDNQRALDISTRNGWRRTGVLAPHPGWRRHIALIQPLPA